MNTNSGGIERMEQRWAWPTKKFIADRRQTINKWNSERMLEMQGGEYTNGSVSELQHNENNIRGVQR